jgi:hypothetical protein
MGREVNESAEDWYARAVQRLRVARAEEDEHWSRLSNGPGVNGQPPTLDRAYLDAVERAERAQREVSHAANQRAVEQPI